MIYPDPKHYSKWQDWAALLIKGLKAPAFNFPLQLVRYNNEQLPKPNPDGMVVLLLDDSQGAIPVYSSSGDWLRVKDNTPAGLAVDIELPLIEFTLTSFVPTITTT